MLTRYWDRRRFIRVPASGPVRWQSNGRSGLCEMVDISPGGAGLRMTARKAAQLGERVTLEVTLPADEVWRLPADSRVVRRVPDADGQCIVGVEFPAESWNATA